MLELHQEALVARILQQKSGSYFKLQWPTHGNHKFWPLSLLVPHLLCKPAAEGMTNPHSENPKSASEAGTQEVVPN